VPELPEVERARALIEARALRRRIVAVVDDDTYVCRPHAPGEIAAALQGRELTAVHRRGKTMWVETDGGAGPVLGLHLGMAGRIVVDDHEAGDPPPAREGAGWDRFTLRFADGGALHLRDKRRLGRAVLHPRVEALGPDALDVGRDEFRERVGRSTAPIKARLMNQAVIAGVGNLLADEILWQARLHPLRPAAELGSDELDTLYRATRAVVKRSVRRGGAHTGDLNPHRRPGGRCPRCGAELERARVGGRTTWWCPVEQR
jgi:formamidopyrimidine-DNA glycosylase